VLGREGEEGTTAELGEGGVWDKRDKVGGEGDGELEGELSGTGEDGSERHEDEDKDGDEDADGTSSLSISNEGDEGGWNESDDFPSPLFTLARLF